MQLKLDLLTSPSVRAKANRSASSKVYNGRRCSLGSPSSLRAMKINRTAVSLAKNGNLNITPQASNEALSLEILNSIGCSQVLDPKINSVDYSLIPSQIDKEIIMNPNKIDMGIFKNVGKGKIHLDKVLASGENNFYRLDQEISKNYAIEQKQIKENVSKNIHQNDKIIASLYDINFLNPSVPSLRSIRRNDYV